MLLPSELYPIFGIQQHLAASQAVRLVEEGGHLLEVTKETFITFQSCHLFQLTMQKWSNPREIIPRDEEPTKNYLPPPVT